MLPTPLTAEVSFRLRKRSIVHKFTEKLIFINQFSFFQAKNAVKVSKFVTRSAKVPPKSPNFLNPLPTLGQKSKILNPLSLRRGGLKLWSIGTFCGGHLIGSIIICTCWSSIRWHARYRIGWCDHAEYGISKPLLELAKIVHCECY